MARTRGMLVRSIIANSPAPIVVTDRKMRYLEVSPSWLSHHNLSPDAKLVGKLHYDVLPDVPEEWREEHRKALKGAIIRRKTTLGRGPAHGKHRGKQAGSVVFPWHGPDGSVGGLIIMVTLLDEALTEQELPLHLAQLYAGGAAGSKDH